MMWKNDFKVDVADFNKNVVAVKINDGACQRALIGFYGLPYSTKRRKAWENLGAMLLVIEEPWVCLGDFNLVIDDQEKDRVGKLELQRQIYLLKELMFDLGANGSLSHGLMGDGVKVALDKGYRQRYWWHKLKRHFPKS